MEHGCSSRSCTCLNSTKMQVQQLVESVPCSDLVGRDTKLTTGSTSRTPFPRRIIEASSAMHGVCLGSAACEDSRGAYAQSHGFRSLKHRSAGTPRYSCICTMSGDGVASRRRASQSRYQVILSLQRNANSCRQTQGLTSRMTGLGLYQQKLRQLYDESTKS